MHKAIGGFLILGLAGLPSWAGVYDALDEDPAVGGYEPEVIFNQGNEALIDSLLPLDAVTQSAKRPLDRYKQLRPKVLSPAKPKIRPVIKTIPMGDFTFGKEKLLYPLALSYPVSSLFGMRTHPITGLMRFHRGIDLAAPAGAPVLATFSGLVLNAGPLGNLGNAVILGHGAKLRTRYGHLDTIEVAVGQSIRQGTVLGTVGSTGLSTGPHLHFELWQYLNRSWQVLDPTGFLKFQAAPPVKKSPRKTN